MRKLVDNVVENNAAYIVQRINSIWGESPGKKILQKIVYLIKQKGVGLSYEYGLHFYGPYSSALDSDTLKLNSDGIIDVNRSGYSHYMSISNGYDVKHENLSQAEIDVIDEVIKRYRGKTPSELELLTTAIYAYDNLAVRTKDSVMDGVRKIKGSKYTNFEILDSIKEFDYFNKRLE